TSASRGLFPDRSPACCDVRRDRRRGVELCRLGRFQVALRSASRPRSLAVLAALLRTAGALGAEAGGSCFHFDDPEEPAARAGRGCPSDVLILADWDDGLDSPASR